MSTDTSTAPLPMAYAAPVADVPRAAVTARRERGGVGPVALALPASVEAVVFPTLHSAGDPEGYVRGHAAGYAAGLRRAAAEAAVRDEQLRSEQAALRADDRARTDHAVAVLQTAAGDLMARTAPVLAEADARLVAAAIDLAEMVLGCELSDAPGGARAALARALSASDHADVVAVRLHPEDALLVTGDAERAGVTVTQDAHLRRGDAVAVYPDGELDARIGSALDRARAALGSVLP